MVVVVVVAIVVVVVVVVVVVFEEQFSVLMLASTWAAALWSVAVDSVPAFTAC